jgi:hypothetical protein
VKAASPAFDGLLRYESLRGPLSRVSALRSAQMNASRPRADALMRNSPTTRGIPSAKAMSARAATPAAYKSAIVSRRATVPTPQTWAQNSLMTPSMPRPIP